MPQNHMHPLGNQFFCRIGGHFGFTDIIFNQQFNLLAQDTTAGIDLLDNQFGGFESGDSVG